MKYTMQELKDIYREASARSESEDYEHIAGRVECVLKGETKCCRFQLFEKDLISACFVEDDDACIVNGTYDEHVKRYGSHAELVMKMYGVKKAKAQTAETAVTETEQSEKAETVEQTEVEETAEIETANPETAETDDSRFEYYSVETVYEVDFRDRQNEIFKTYSEAEKTAGDNIILEVDLIVRNDKKAVSEHDKEVFENETDEIEHRCIWYHFNGVKGMIAQDTKRVIKKPETKEKVIENFESETFNIAKAEEKKTQFDFYNVTIGFEVEKFIGTIPADYESLGIYSDYEKAVQAAQAAADEYGAENIYFHTVEIAARNDREVYDRDDYEDFIEERETIRHNWYTLTIVDTGKREHVNLDKPVRLDFEE